MSARPNLDSDGAISCLDLPLSSLSTDIYEDEEDVEERDSSYRSALYAHWWLKAPFKKQTDLWFIETCALISSAFREL